jgi:hypothetical protein
MTQHFDVTRLVKLMMMTTSSNDNEALVAMRKANAVLGASQKNWQDILLTPFARRPEPPPRPEPQPQQQQHRKPDPKPASDPKTDLINAMFETLLKEVSPESNFRSFVLSVHVQWLKRNRLTDKQYRAIRKAYLNYKPEAETDDDRR